MSERYKLTNEEINKAVLHSPYALADSPYKRGLGAAQIKKYFYDFIIYLANSFNAHLGDVGDTFDNVDKSISELGTRVSELHETDLQLTSRFTSELSKAVKELQGADLQTTTELTKALNEHNSGEDAHRDLRALIDSAIAIATGRTKVHVETDFYSMIGDISMAADSFNEGDFIVITQKSVPDFIVLRKGAASSSAVSIKWEENTGGAIDIVPSVGERYYIEGSSIEIIAIESGVDITVDSEISNESTNPVQNRAVALEFAEFSRAYDIIIGNAVNECKQYTDSSVGEIGAALAELHNYAEELKGGEA